MLLILLLLVGLKFSVFPGGTQEGQKEKFTEQAAAHRDCLEYTYLFVSFEL